MATSYFNVLVLIGGFMEKYVLTVRLDEDVKKELDNLCSVYGVSKNYLVSMLIRQEYNKVETDPKIQKTLEQINQLKSLIEQFSNDDDVHVFVHDKK